MENFNAWCFDHGQYLFTYCVCYLANLTLWIQSKWSKIWVWINKILTCNILHLLVSHSSSMQGWYIPKVTQLSKMTIIDTLSNHVCLVKEITLCIWDMTYIHTKRELTKNKLRITFQTKWFVNQNSGKLDHWRKQNFL